MFISEFILGAVAGIVGVCLIAVIYSKYKK